MCATVSALAAAEVAPPGFLAAEPQSSTTLLRRARMSGAPRVVATLWEIDDRTTAEVMKRFYEGMLARGERPAAALTAAQVAMWRTRGWDVPYYWAAFTLQGEWR
jgi:CHAT domain-containing protein